MSIFMKSDVRVVSISSVNHTEKYIDTKNNNLTCAHPATWRHIPNSVLLCDISTHCYWIIWF